MEKLPSGCEYHLRLKEAISAKVGAELSGLMTMRIQVEFLRSL